MSDEVRAALNALRGKVERWRLDYLHEYLQFDAAKEPNRLIGAEQNLAAGLRGLASELGASILGPIELAEAVRRSDAEN